MNSTGGVGVGLTLRMASDESKGSFPEFGVGVFGVLISEARLTSIPKLLRAGRLRCCDENGGGGARLPLELDDCVAYSDESIDMLENPGALESSN